MLLNNCEIKSMALPTQPVLRLRGPWDRRCLLLFRQRLQEDVKLSAEAAECVFSQSVNNRNIPESLLREEQRGGDVASR